MVKINKKLQKRRVEDLEIYRRLENRFVIKFKGELRRFRNEVIVNIELGVKTIPLQSKQTHILKMLEILKTLARVCFKIGKKREQIKIEKKFDENFEFERFISDYLSTELLTKVKDITDTSFKVIENIIKVNIANQASNQTIAKLIKNDAKIDRIRANTIARTEVHNAYSTATFRQAQEIDRVLNEAYYKVWLPALDERTRKSHSKMLNHPPVLIDQPFNVGDEKLMHPGDPKGSAKEVINCRCSMITGTKKVMNYYGYQV